MRMIESLEAGQVYHIINRGINGEDLFKEKRNYHHFLNKYQEYCADILEIYAYALLKNHFHLLVKVKEDVTIKRKDGKGEIELNASRQLSHFFNAYAQSYNKAYKRHGKLLEEPFKRKIVSNEDYFTSLIYYIHFNPQQHKFVTDFRDWEFTSWHTINNAGTSFLQKEKVIDWFGSINRLVDAHIGNMPLANISHLVLE